MLHLSKSDPVAEPHLYDRSGENGPRHMESESVAEDVHHACLDGWSEGDQGIEDFHAGRSIGGDSNFDSTFERRAMRWIRFR